MKRLYITCLITIMLLVDIFLLYRSLFINFCTKIVVYLLLFPLIIVPYLYSVVTNKNLDIYLKMIYYTFLFFAHFLGSVMALYSKIYWFDTFVHYLSGILTSFIAVLLLKKYDIKLSKESLFIFMICFTCFVATFWEFFEYSIDTFFHTNLQHTIEVGIHDTMKDIMMALLGNITFFYLYIQTNFLKKIIQTIEL